MEDSLEDSVLATTVRNSLEDPVLATTVRNSLEDSVLVTTVKESSSRFPHTFVASEITRAKTIT